MMKLSSILLCLALFLFHLSAEAKIYGPKRYDSTGLLTYVSGEIYYTTENFDLNSKVNGLSSSNSFLLLDIPFGIRYAISPTWSFDGELKASYAQSKSADTINGGDRTNSEVHQARFSTDFLIETKGFDLIPEFEIVYPFNKISSTTDSVMVGEGARSLIGKLNLQTEFSSLDFFSYLGYEMRDSGRSNLLPWSVGLGWNSNGSLLGARIFGFQSMSEDSDKNQRITREALNDKVNGGSLKFYSIDPSIVSAEVLWFLKFQRQWQIQFNFGLNLAGQSYSKGMFAGLNLILDWGEKQRSLRQRPKREVMQPQGSGFAVEPGTIDFKEDTNELKEQKYFIPPEAPRIKLKPAPRTRKTRKRRTAPSDQQIQDQMDDAEMQIELKRKKRK
jgi:hypothetical protein